MSISVGIVGYTNSLPLTRYLPEDWSLRNGHPKDVDAWLADGEVQVALAPVGAALTNPEHRIIPGFCIGADGPVTSVLLVSESPVEDWTEVVLDGVSRTSVLLAQLLLKSGPLSESAGKNHGKKPVIVHGAPGSGTERARGTVASVVIGDVARELPDRLTVRLDLAALWKQWTGLPFVFAVWATHEGLDPALADAISLAGEVGVKNREGDFSGPDLAYVTQAIRYPLDDKALMGLRRFVALVNRELAPKGDVLLHEPRLLAPKALNTRHFAADVQTILGHALTRPLTEAELVLLAREAKTVDLMVAADLINTREHGDAVDFQPMVTDAHSAKAHQQALKLGVTHLKVTKASTTAAQVAAFDQQGFVVQAPAQLLAEAKVSGGQQAPDIVGMDVPRIRSAYSAVNGVEVGEEEERSTFSYVATLGVGQGETVEEACARLVKIQRQFDQNPERFVALVCWAGHLGGPVAAEANTAVDHLRWTALCRLALPGVTLWAAPESEGLGMAQASLAGGCDHFGQVVLGSDPSKWDIQLEKVVYTIRQAKRTPSNVAFADLSPNRRRRLDAR